MRLIGAVIVFICCGYFGYSMVAVHKKEERTLRQIICAIEYMGCELQYRLTPLPQLLGQASREVNGIVSSVLASLSTELDSQISPDVSTCMEAILCKRKDIPQYASEAFRALGKGLGRFDLEGQIKELDSVGALCTKRLTELECNRDIRLRSYQTFGLCAGAVIAILLL